MNCQDHLYRNVPPRALARRWFLKECGVGLGAIALGQLTGGSVAHARRRSACAASSRHFAPRAKNVIFLFMAGAPSHLELFDNKPQLAKYDGTLPPPELLKGYRAAFINPNSKLLGPKFKFAKHGQCGAELSELLPHLADVVDDIAIVKSMTTDAFNHAPAQILMSTGSQQFGKPSLGAWTLYGLGSESQNLPGFVVFSTGTKGPSGGNSNWGSGFLPTVYQGVHVPHQRRSGAVSLEPARRRRPAAARFARRDQRAQSPAPRPKSAIRKSPRASTRSRWRTACRPSAPEAIDISQEPEHVSRCTAPSRASPRSPTLPAGPAAGRARRAVRRDLPRSLGPARQPGQRHQEELCQTPTRPARP